MMRLSRATRLAALLLAAVALTVPAACGGGSPTQPAPFVPQPVPDTPTPVPPPAPAPVPRISVTRILAFGDSMTEGTTSTPVAGLFALDAGLPRSYPFQLQTLLRERYSEQTVEVFNGGRAGRRATQDRERFNAAMSDARPQVILLMEGANDLNAPFEAGEGINDRIRTTTNALEDMIRDAGARQIPVFLATLPPQRPGAPKAGAAAFVTRFNDALRAMAAKKGAEIVDVFSGLTTADIGQDGLHPTEAGYRRIAEIWLQALKARYETAPPAGGGSAAAAQEPGAGHAAGVASAPAAGQAH